MTSGFVSWGTFLCFMGGIIFNEGTSSVSNSVWPGIAYLIGGSLIYIGGILQVNKGIREIVSKNRNIRVITTK